MGSKTVRARRKSAKLEVIAKEVAQPQLEHPPKKHELLLVDRRWALCQKTEKAAAKAQIIFLEQVGNLGYGSFMPEEIDLRKYSGGRWTQSTNRKSHYAIHDESQKIQPEKLHLTEIVGSLQLAEVGGLDQLIQTAFKEIRDKRNLVVWGELKTTEGR